ncbi:ash family protein [Pantoea cypripedii]|uniref:ash family protein n=1 Tax=Pantoea cypripedii TaxID=55209 RepID=UPI0039F187D1
MLNSSFSLAGVFQYNQHAAAKSAVGISVPQIFLMPENSGNACARLSMVAQAGASQEAPVPKKAGNANSVWATTQGVSVSGGSQHNYFLEAAIWLLPFLVCTRNTFVPIRGCVMYDTTPLSAEEVLDHCRALAFAIVELDQSLVKELLMYVLQERLNLLNETLQAEASHE